MFLCMVGAFTPVYKEGVFSESTVTSFFCQSDLCMWGFFVTITLKVSTYKADTANFNPMLPLRLIAAFSGQSNLRAVCRRSCFITFQVAPPNFCSPTYSAQSTQEHRFQPNVSQQSFHSRPPSSSAFQTLTIAKRKLTTSNIWH